MSTPDLTSYYAVHTALRAAPHRLVAAVPGVDPGDRRRTAAIARYWRGFAGEVLAHHAIEDDVFFPALVAEIPATADLLVRSDADHHRLDELMAACGAAVERVEHGSRPAVGDLTDALRALADHMDAHLAFEDAEILPLFQHRFTAEAYEALEARAHKSLGLGAQAAFTVPFLAAAVAPEVRAAMFAGAPAPFRVLYRATRGRFARLEARALGPVAATAR